MFICLKKLSGTPCRSVVNKTQNSLIMRKLAMWALGALFVAGCAETEKATTDSGLVKSNFQTEVGGKKTDLYVLRIRTTWRFASLFLEDVLFR